MSNINDMIDEVLIDRGDGCDPLIARNRNMVWYQVDKTKDKHETIHICDCIGIGRYELIPSTNFTFELWFINTNDFSIKFDQFLRLEEAKLQCKKHLRYQIKEMITLVRLWGWVLNDMDTPIGPSIV